MVEETADKVVEGEGEGCSHRGAEWVDNRACKIDLEVVVGQVDNRNVVLVVAGQDHFYFRLILKLLHLNSHLGKKQGLPFFEDPLKDRMLSRAEAYAEC